MDREKAKIKAKVYLQHLSKKGYKCEERNCDAELQSKMNCMAYIISDNKGDRFATVTADFNAIGFMLEYAITEDEKKYKSNLFNMLTISTKLELFAIPYFLIIQLHLTGCFYQLSTWENTTNSYLTIS